MLCMSVLALTVPLRSIDLTLSSTLCSIYTPPKHHTNKDTLFYISKHPYLQYPPSCPSILRREHLQDLEEHVLASQGRWVLPGEGLASVPDLMYVNM